MESQETQFSPLDSSSRTPHATLQFSKDDMKYAELRFGDGRLADTINSDGTLAVSGVRTKIFREGTEEVVADIKRRDFLIDTMSFGGESKRLSKWLKQREGSDFKLPVGFVWQSQTYVWNTNELGQPVFYDERDSTVEIARFERSTGESVGLNQVETHPAMLYLEVPAMSILGDPGGRDEDEGTTTASK